MKTAVLWIVSPCSLVEKYADVSEVLYAVNIKVISDLLMEEKGTYNPKDSHIYVINRRELKSRVHFTDITTESKRRHKLFA